jgi:hypothetical protein
LAQVCLQEYPCHLAQLVVCFFQPS